MSLKENEKQLMKQIEEVGLKRFVKHEYYDPPKEVEYSDDPVTKTKIRKFIAETNVTLEKGKDNVVSLGVSKCSILDNYNKRLGRVIAIGRALKNYLKGDDLNSKDGYSVNAP